MTGPMAPKVVAACGGRLSSLRSRGDSPSGLRVMVAANAAVLEKGGAPDGAGCVEGLYSLSLRGKVSPLAMSFICR